MVGLGYNLAQLYPSWVLLVVIWAAPNALGIENNERGVLENSSLYLSGGGQYILGILAPKRFLLQWVDMAYFV